jgi:hypothetical protein
MVRIISARWCGSFLRDDADHFCAMMRIITYIAAYIITLGEAYGHCQDVFVQIHPDLY